MHLERPEQGTVEVLAHCGREHWAELMFHAFAKDLRKGQMRSMGVKSSGQKIDKAEAIEELSSALDRVTEGGGRDLAFCALMTVYGTAWQCMEQEGHKRDALEKTADRAARAGYAQAFTALRFSSHPR